MKFTNKTFLQYYLEDLTGIDVTHGGRRKTLRPEKWNLPHSFNQHQPIDVLDSTRRVWVWSDQHFNHKHIIEYSNRPYPTVELMNECLIGNYNKVVQPNDIVIWCGDVTFGKVQETNELLNEMPGYKIHILGNHDFKRGGKLNNLVFNEQLPCLVVDVCDAEVEYQLLLTHYPLTDVPVGCFNAHGHIHQHPSPSARHFNVSVEHTNYAPLNINGILTSAKHVMEMHI